KTNSKDFSRESTARRDRLTRRTRIKNQHPPRRHGDAEARRRRKGNKPEWASKDCQNRRNPRRAGTGCKNAKIEDQKQRQKQHPPRRHPSASSTLLEGRLRRRNSMLNLRPSAKVSGEKVLGFDLSWENIAVQSSLAYKVYMDQEDCLTLYPAAFV